MILITVGTTPFPFPRMNTVFAYIVEHRRANEHIVYQHGTTHVATQGRNISLVPYVAFDRLQRYIRNARIVISHAGPATIYQILATGKKPYVLPRSKKWHEHVDDHQIRFTSYLRKLGIVDVVHLTDLATVLRSTHVPTVAPRTRVAESLVTFLDSVTRLRK